MERTASGLDSLKFKVRGVDSQHLKKYVDEARSLISQQSTNDSKSAASNTNSNLSIGDQIFKYRVDDEVIKGIVDRVGSETKTKTMSSMSRESSIIARRERHTLIKKLGLDHKNGIIGKPHLRCSAFDDYIKKVFGSGDDTKSTKDEECVSSTINTDDMDKMVSLPSGKRQATRKENLLNEVKAMRAELPNYSIKDIRELTMPFYEALPLNLEGDGYQWTAAFVMDLMEYQEQLRQKAGSGSALWYRPQLKDEKDHLIYLSAGFMKAENYYKKGNHALECSEILKVAIHFSFMGADWRWLGEKVMRESIKVSSSYPQLHNQYEALSRYAYARFKISSFHNYRDALNQLEKARNLCGRHLWSVRQYFPECKESLITEVNRLAHECYMHESQELLRTDIDECYMLADLAHNRAIECCYFEGQCDALLMKSMCAVGRGNLAQARYLVDRAMAKAKSKNFTNKICKALLVISQLYMYEKNSDECFRALHELKDIAEANDIPFYIGKSYRNWGEYYLMSGEAELAYIFLSGAFIIFMQCGQIEEVNFVRNLQALAAGLQLLPAYTCLISRAENTGMSSRSKLQSILDWKNSRKRFSIECDDEFSDRNTVPTTSTAKFHVDAHDTDENTQKSEDSMEPASARNLLQQIDSLVACLK